MSAVDFLKENTRVSTTKWKKKVRRGDGKTKCCIEGCEKLAVTKGLCQPCYEMALVVVNSGITTWEELHGMGLCISKKEGFKVKSKFMLAFAKKRKTWDSQNSA